MIDTVRSKYHLQIIRAKVGFSRVEKEMLEILELIDRYPDLTTARVVTELPNSQAACYRIIALMKNRGLIVETPDKILKPNFPKFIREFLVPTYLRQGILPPKEYSATHLASHLANYKDEQTPVGFTQTKKEILEGIKQTIRDTPGMDNKLTLALQNALAAIALMSGDLSCWENMVGTLEPPTSMDEVIQSILNH